MKTKHTHVFEVEELPLATHQNHKWLVRCLDDIRSYVVENAI